MKKFTITKERFLDWYFYYGQEEETKELKEGLVNSIIDQMYKVGFGTYSVEELFDNCNKEAIRVYCTQEYLGFTDTHDVELSDFTGTDFEITLI